MRRGHRPSEPSILEMEIERERGREFAAVTSGQAKLLWPSGDHAFKNKTASMKDSNGGIGTWSTSLTSDLHNAHRSDGGKKDNQGLSESRASLVMFRNYTVVSRIVLCLCVGGREREGKQSLDFFWYYAKRSTGCTTPFSSVPATCPVI